MKRIYKYNKFLEKKSKFPDIKEYDFEGFKVYMGRDSKSNDYLTFIQSDEDDLWFHAKGVPGSHIVIKINDNLPTETVIKAVAELAKKNSKGKENEKQEVVYCKRKFVTKEPGMNDGQVLVDNKNSNFITV